jgi:hypothetical protein
VRRDDEDDHSGGTSWVDRIVIPDDISELDAEVRALRRERRAGRRRDKLRRLTGGGRTAGPLLLVAVLLVAGVAGLMVLFQPRRTTSGAATLGTSQAGDRRLPDVSVGLADGTSRRVREIRPVVLALATDDCDCDAALRDTAQAVRRHSLSFALVDLTMPRLPTGLTAPGTIQLAEPTGAITERYGAVRDGRRVPGGPVLVLVGSNGDVVRVLPQASPKTLEDELSALVPQAAPAS